MQGGGDLRYKIGFYKRVDIDDGAGNTQGGYDSLPVFTTAGNIKPRLGGETVLAGRLTGTNLVNITVRNSANARLVDDDWIACNERTGETYNIRSIIDPNQDTAQRGRFLELLGEKGVAFGFIASDGGLDFGFPDESGLLVAIGMA